MSIGNGKLKDVEADGDIMSLIGVCRKCRCALMVELDMTIMSPETAARMVANILKEHTATCGGFIKMDNPNEEDNVEVELSEECETEQHKNCSDEDCECVCHGGTTEE